MWYLSFQCNDSLQDGSDKSKRSTRAKVNVIAMRNAPQTKSTSRTAKTKVNRANKRNKNIRKRSIAALTEKILRESPGKEFILNEIVLATVPGFVPWPARIVEINGETLRVEFFGTGEM